jgi:leader peptidase (prepilin peptidase)/N-methyltransferase
MDYNTLLIIASILFGASWGSFLNVVISRVPEGLSVVYPPSRCPVCKSKIKPYHNIPIISYIILKGRCNNCSTKISIEYPIVEFIGAVMGLALYLEFDFTIEYLYYFIFTFGMISLAFIDLKHWLVPDSIMIILAIVGLAIPTISYFLNYIFYIDILDSLIGGLTGFLVIALIILLYKYVRKIDALGWGDAYILGIIGIYLGAKGALASLFFSVFQASIVGITMILLNKKQTVPYDDVKDDDPIKDKAALPFVPFLIIGSLEYLFWGEKILSWWFNFMKMGN